MSHSRPTLALLVWWSLCHSLLAQPAPSLDDLVRRLSDADREVRRDAANELADRGPAAAPAIMAIADGVHDYDPQVFATCTQILADFGPVAATAMNDLLQELDKNRDDDQQIYRLGHALGRMGTIVLPSLRERLSADGTRVRRGAVIAIGEMGAHADVAVPELVRRLDDNDEQVRVFASEALGRMGTGATPDLIAALATGSRQVVLGAVNALAAIGPEAHHAMKELIRLSQPSDDTGIRAAAILALASISPNSEDVLRPLLDATSDMSEDVGRAAVNSWYRLSPQLQRRATPLLAHSLTSDSMVASRVAIVLSGFASRGAAATPALLERLIEQPDSDVWANCLGCIGEPALGALFDCLDERRLKPEHVARVVKQMPVQTRQHVTARLHDTSPLVREVAVRTIGGEVRVDEAGKTDLKHALYDEDQYVRLAAARGLGELGFAAASMAPELAKLTSRETVPEVRAAAVWGVGKTESDLETLFGVLSHAMDDSNAVVRQQAIFRLANCDQVPVDFQNRLGDALATNADPTVRAAAARALSRVSSQQIISAQLLANALSDREAQVQIAVLRAVPALGDAAAGIVQQVAGKLESDELEICIRALDALTELGTIAAESLPNLAQLATHPDVDVRRLAVNAVRPIGGDKAVPILVLALGDEHSQVRHLAATELGLLGGAAGAAIPALLTMLDNQEDREIARRSLRNFVTVSDELIPTLMDMLRDESKARSAQSYILYFLRARGPKASVALPLLREKLAAASLRERPEWEKAIREIEGVMGTSPPAQVDK